MSNVFFIDIIDPCNFSQTFDFSAKRTSTYIIFIIIIDDNDY